MIWVGFQIGAGLALFGVVMAVLAWCGAMLIDGIDWWASRITPEEATRRAKLTSIGKWPPPEPKPWRSARDWVALFIGLTLIAAATGLYRSWLR